MPARTSEPLIVEPDSGITIALGTSSLTIKLGAEATGGRFALLDYDIAPNFLPPQVPHGHTMESQTAYVVRGEIQFEFASRTIDAGEGTVIHISEHCGFTWRNRTADPARMLYIFAPAGLERFFVDVQNLYKEHPDASPADIAPHVASLWAKYGIFSEA